MTARPIPSFHFSRAPRWPAHGGETAALIRERDWSKTRLGSPEYWPASLRTAIDIALERELPTMLLWGTDLVQFYNDAYREFMGKQHPWAIGRTAEECWPEEWPRNEPIFRRVLSGEAVTIEDLALGGVLGGASQVRFTLSLSPVRGEDASVAAIFVTASETARLLAAEAELQANSSALATLRHDHERELAALTRLHDLGGRLAAGSDLQALLYGALDATIGLQGADFGHVKLYSKETGTLEILAQRGFGEEFLNYFSKARIAAGGSGHAIRARARAVIEDVETDPRYAEHRDIAARTGFRALQSTPLFDRSGELLGTLSTHFRRPHRPSERELWLTDLYARQTADVIAYKLSERTLKASEERFRLLTEATAAIVWRADGGGAVIDAPRWSVFTGQTPDQYKGFGWLDALHPDDRPAAMATWEDAFKQARIVETVDRMRHVSGGYRWVQVRGVPLLGADGAIREWIGTVTDIHEQKQAAEALRQSEERFRLATEALQGAVADFDVASRQLADPEPLARLVGAHPAGVGDFSAFWWKSIHPEDQPLVAAAVQAVMANESSLLDIEYRMRHRDGAWLQLWTRGLPMRDASGAVARIIATTVDISERKRAERALLDSEARLAAILEQLPVGVGLTNRDGRFEVRNTALRRYTGDRVPSHFPEAELVWRSLGEDGEPLPRHQWPSARALRGETVNPGIDFIYTWKDGREVWMRVKAAPFYNNGGELTGAVTVLENVDQEKRAEQAKSVLIAELQHRTRNLLAVVKGLSAQTLASSTSLEDFESRFKERLASLSRVQGLLSRAHDQRITIDDLVRMELAALGAEVAEDRVFIDGPEVALPNRVVQTLALALHELATNALKYGALSGADGSLAVTWRSGERGAEGTRLMLEWAERGAVSCGGSGVPVRRGYGRELIERALPYELDAQTHFELTASGVRCSIEIPLGQDAR